jgi:hypothetical protein
MRHVREARVCSRGARQFFARHGLDWQAFLSDGLDPETVRGTGDAMAIAVAELAEAEHGRQQQETDGRV